MSRSKILGSGEMAVLRGLHYNRGQWVSEDGALYDSKYWTLRLLASLTGKGLVDEVVPEEHYKLTKAGVELQAQWGFFDTHVISDE